MARFLRIAVLLVILATVAQQAWLARSRAVAWKDSLQVAVYPINGDGSAATQDYVAGLGRDDFQPIEGFMAREAARHGVALTRPVEISVAPPVAALPPPAPARANALDAVVWSLKMRYWAWRNGNIAGPKPNVRLFVLFFDPARQPRLPHSVGLERGLIGVVNAFAGEAMAGSNNVVIAHELLHTLGATDKYDPGSNQPRFPDGYAEPQRTPLHPQEYAELMAGRIPVAPNRADIPDNLEQVLIGGDTAAEIRWHPRR